MKHWFPCCPRFSVRGPLLPRRHPNQRRCAGWGEAHARVARHASIKGAVWLCRRAQHSHAIAASCKQTGMHCCAWLAIRASDSSCFSLTSRTL